VPLCRRDIAAPDAPEAAGGYAQAVETTGAERVLYISGQIPASRDGTVPADFKAQCRLAWRNVEAQLRAAGMSLDNLVKVTTYLADRRHAGDNRAIRQEALGDRRPALTVIVAGIFDEPCLVEIEAIAVA
jgi:2-iminobutanoate/2-iminopropanoate deaminase